jgi:branched-chain amino acid transport system substrate-binding protein
MLPLLSTQKSRVRSLALIALLFFALQSYAFAQAISRPDDSLLLKEGEALLAQGDVEKALWRFKQLTVDFPKSPLLNEAKFKMGVSYTLLKRPRDAIRVLNDLLSTFLPAPRMVDTFTLLGDNFVELRDPHEALRWYGKGLLVPNQPQEELKKKIRTLLDGFDTEKELSQVETLYRGAYAGGVAKSRLAQIAKRRGDGVLANKIQDELRKEYGQTDFGSRPKDSPAPPPPPLPSPKFRVGVVLPLSGVHQTFGEKVLRSIQLAFKENIGEENRELASLVVRDSQGNPGAAEKAVEELVSREKVIAVIGPLLSTTTDRAARKANQLKVPLITLSPKESFSGKGDFLFQNSLTPSSQIQALTAFAVEQLKHRTFAVFYPNSPYGLSFKSLFSQEIARKGGKVLGSVAYLESQTDFGQEIKGFFKLEPIPGQTSKKKGEEEFKAGISVDGLFIPDTYDRVALILSQMAYYDVKGVTFLGNNGWNHPGLVPAAGNSVEGAVFVDAFFKEDPSSPVRRFVQEFRSAHRRDPDTLEGLAFEAAQLLTQILRSKSPSSPVQLKEEIYRMKGFQGIAGLKGFTEDGKVIRTLSILRVTNGRIEMVTP